jgi:hypothetical protein
MIVASFTPPSFPHLRELRALGVEAHPQPRHALPRQFTSLAPAPRQILASLRTHSNSRNPLPFMALLHTSLDTPGVGVHPHRTSPATSQIAANSIRIRTSPKHTHNPFRIRTSKGNNILDTQDGL